MCSLLKFLMRLPVSCDIIIGINIAFEHDTRLVDIIVQNAQSPDVPDGILSSTDRERD